MPSVREQYWRYSLVALIVGLGTVVFVELTPFLGGLMGAFGFAMFFGGTVFDGIMAVVVRLVVCLMDFNRPKYLNQIACTALISAFAGVLITLISRFCGGWFPINTAVVSIAVIMLLIPGLALGNAVRDLLCGELVSGLVKMLQCCCGCDCGRLHQCADFYRGKHGAGSGRSGTGPNSAVYRAVHLWVFHAFQRVVQKAVLHLFGRYALYLQLSCGH